MLSQPLDLRSDEHEECRSEYAKQQKGLNDEISTYHDITRLEEGANAILQSDWSIRASTRPP